MNKTNCNNECRRLKFLCDDGKLVALRSKALKTICIKASILSQKSQNTKNSTTSREEYSKVRNATHNPIEDMNFIFLL